MTGLDKILAQIKLQNEVLCDDIRRRADEECDAIINAAEINAKSILEKGNADSIRKSEDIISRAKTSAEIQNRSMILKTKQECIRKALESARMYILDLPEKEYFLLILSMISKCSEDKDGVISFSDRDLQRLPENFCSSANDISKGSIRISDDPANIDGGFILSYGDVEYNCAFKAIFDDNIERFSDEVNKILFS